MLSSFGNGRSGYRHDNGIRLEAPKNGREANSIFRLKRFWQYSRTGIFASASGSGWKVRQAKQEEIGTWIWGCLQRPGVGQLAYANLESTPVLLYKLTNDFSNPLYIKGFRVFFGCLFREKGQQKTQLSTVNRKKVDNYFSDKTSVKTPPKMTPYGAMVTLG